MTTLNRAILFVQDMDSMTAFYEGQLGLVVQSRSENWTLLGDSGYELALHLIPEEYREKRSASTSEVNARTHSQTKLCFFTEDAVKCRDKLVTQGIPMKGPVYLDDIVYCDGVDPEGNVFQLWNG